MAPKLTITGNIVALVVVVVAAIGASPLLASAAYQDVMCRGVTTYCNNLIETYHPTWTNELMEVAINDTVKKLSRAKAKVEALSRTLPKGSYDVTSTLICAKYYEDEAFDLSRFALGYLKQGQTGALLAFTSAAPDSIESCYEIHDPDNKFGEHMQFPGRDVYDSTLKNARRLARLACNFVGQGLGQCN